ncbi:molybdopterin-synthase adenylyltransferase MoeB [Dickeya undicola]|uniref:Molybdopterin-synthase adenylyltransferase MoeB n=2 Tax=Dickeya undicola TaxID=1577887 RepID=A0ABX9X1B5_9GAMM|nr:molybdopterin-synthase adenylyltransferase MoeB [Dickeya undicola]
MRPPFIRSFQTEIKTILYFSVIERYSFMSNIVDGIDSIRSISIDELKDNNGFLLVDVRESHEYLDGTIPKALTIGRGFLEIELKKRKIELDKPIVLFCASGLRSRYAALSLTLLNYSNIYSLQGGFEAWKAQGNKIEYPLSLSDNDKKRYARHLSLQDIGSDGQFKIMQAKVLVVGAGGLGSSCLLYLAAAGVGEIAIVDHDIVDLSNLQRQVIHNENMLKRKKVDSALHTLRALNSEITINTIDDRVTPENIDALVDSYDVIVDCTDNFKARYIINDAAVAAGKPVVSAAVFRFSGQVMTRSNNQAPCYRCVYPEAPPAELAPSCTENGVIGVIPGMLGIYQANEVLKIILGIGECLNGKLLKIDMLNNQHLLLTTKKRPGCQCHNN